MANKREWEERQKIRGRKGGKRNKKGRVKGGEEREVRREKGMG